MDRRLELVAVPVSDVDRAKAFYTSARLRLLDRARRGIVETPPGSVQGLQMLVDDIHAVHAELAGRRVEVSDGADRLRSA